MKIVYVTQSLLSCWNHGNAHFLRGVLRELVKRGHDVIALEPAEGWSRTNLVADHGVQALQAFGAAYPDLACALYRGERDVLEALERADLVIVHEWTHPAIVAAIGRARRNSRFTLLFHDTHHRAVSDPAAIAAFDLRHYDGVLAFGAALADVYRRLGWGTRAFVWHEAADATHFRPPPVERERQGIVWIGNWGDGERAAELNEFLFIPARDAGLALDVYGVRYPSDTLAALARTGVRYRGWLPNVEAPHVFAQHLATVHVPRRAYTGPLRGIPTIRVFEALACGIPLVCSPWDDSEGLFRPGRDYLVARTGAEMTLRLRALAQDADLRAALSASGRAAILARHTCAHRVDELLAIVAAIQDRTPLEVTA